MPLMLLLPLATSFAQSDAEALRWLSKMRSATQRLSYAGTFVYQHGGEIDTSRIARIVDSLGARERLEPLDGAAREIIRTRDRLTAYYPGSAITRTEISRREPRFPEILPEQLEELAQNYVIRTAGRERIAGFECQSVLIEPKDRYRYGHKLWGELKTGMLIKAKTFNIRQEPMDSFSFIELQIGRIDAGKVRSLYAASARRWRVETSQAQIANLADEGWLVGMPIPGYRKVAEMRRNIGASSGVGHVVFSDGLATLSIFIERVSDRPAIAAGRSLGDATSVYFRQLGNYRIVVVGEAPMEGIMLVANAVEYRKPKINSK